MPLMPHGSTGLWLYTEPNFTLKLIFDSSKKYYTMQMKSNILCNQQNLMNILRFTFQQELIIFD